MLLPSFTFIEGAVIGGSVIFAYKFKLLWRLSAINYKEFTSAGTKCGKNNLIICKQITFEHYCLVYKFCQVSIAWNVVSDRFVAVIVFNASMHGERELRHITASVWRVPLTNFFFTALSNFLFAINLVETSDILEKNYKFKVQNSRFRSVQRWTVFHAMILSMVHHAGLLGKTYYNVLVRRRTWNHGEERIRGPPLHSPQGYRAECALLTTSSRARFLASSRPCLPIIDNAQKKKRNAWDGGRYL